MKLSFPDREKYKYFYEAAAENYSPEGDLLLYKDDRFFNIRNFIRKEIEDRQRPLVILDVGCGNGWLMAPFAGGNEVYGLDISEANVNKARKKGIKARLHDVETPFPFVQNFFDVVVCSEVLEHLFFPEGVLREINRVLKSGGLCIITVPNLYSLRNRFKMLVGRNCSYVEYPQNKEHIRHYSISGMKALLRKAGLKVEYIRGQSWVMNFRWPFKLIWLLHGGNRGLKLFIRIVTLGKVKARIPGIML